MDGVRVRRAAEGVLASTSGRDEGVLACLPCTVDEEGRGCISLTGPLVAVDECRWSICRAVESVFALISGRDEGVLA